MFCCIAELNQIYYWGFNGGEDSWNLKEPVQQILTNDARNAIQAHLKHRTQEQKNRNPQQQ